MKVFSLILAILIGAQVAHAARDCKTTRGRTFAEQLATLDAKVDLDLIDLDFFKGGSLVTGYEYEVEPAYTNGLYARTDRWQIKTDLVPKHQINISEGFDVEVGAGLKYHTEATFVRFMSDPCRAMLSSPYSPKRIPLKASVALGPKFNIGDYFLFRGSVGFIVGGEILDMLGSTFWGVNLSANYLLEGFYQIHIVRLDEKHIRFKVVGHRGNNTNVTLGLGWEREFNVFKVSALDNGLEKFVNTKPIKVKVDKNKAKIFMVDYILDLTNPEVTVAFESVLKKIKGFQNIKLIKPFQDKAIENHFLMDLTPLEDLYRRDLENENVERIKRNLRTSSEQDTYAFGFTAGNKVLGYKWGREVSTSFMSVRSENDTLNRFLLKSWDHDWEGRFFYSWVKSREISGLRALFTADESFVKLRPINLVNHLTKRKNRISFKDFQKIKKRLKKAIPDELFQKIPWENWNQTSKDKFTNFGLRFELLMTPEVIFSAPELTQDEIAVMMKDHLLSKGLRPEDFFGSSASPSKRDRETPEQKFNKSLKSFSRLLSDVLNQKKLGTERLSILTDLRKNKLFKEAGFSFIMALMPDKMMNWYHLDLNISSNEAQIDYDFGDAELSSLYKKLLTIKAALDDDALDLLREAESLSIKASY